MAKKKAATTTTPPPPQVFKASLGMRGEVVKGAQITEAQAVAERQAGRDVVVCGNNLPANRDMAKRIEQTANGGYKRCPPHPNAGPDALPHYQPNPRPPAGHFFLKQPTAKQNERCHEILYD